MQTVTIDILKDGAVRLLQDMELLELIRMRREKGELVNAADMIARYKGAMTRQPLDEVDKQIDELRNEWQ